MKTKFLIGVFLLSILPLTVYETYAWDPANQPPVAVIEIEPGSQSVNIYEPAFFYGGNSYDPDGYITDYYWIYCQYGCEHLIDSEILSGYRYTVTLEAPGQYTLGLQVKDNKGAVSEPAWVTIFIEPTPIVLITHPTSSSNDLAITATPSMPSETCRARMLYCDYVPYPLTFNWTYEAKFNQDGGYTHKTWTGSSIASCGGAETAWNVPFGNIFRGGDVTIIARVTIGEKNPITYTSSELKPYKIKGTNPSQSQIFGIANFIEAKAVCWQESGHRQFNAIATQIGMPLPCYAHDGGFGLMMPTPASEEEIWNWQTNLSNGVSYLNTCHTDAQNYLNYWYDHDNGEGWGWNPRTDHPDWVWDEAFSRYRTGDSIYSPNGNHGVRNCAINQTGCNYANRVRGYINNPPW